MQQTSPREGGDVHLAHVPRCVGFLEGHSDLNRVSVNMSRERGAPTDDELLCPQLETNAKHCATLWYEIDPMEQSLDGFHTVLAVGRRYDEWVAMHTVNGHLYPCSHIVHRAVVPIRTVQHVTMLCRQQVRRDDDHEAREDGRRHGASNDATVPFFLWGQPTTQNAGYGSPGGSWVNARAERLSFAWNGNSLPQYTHRSDMTDTTKFDVCAFTVASVGYVPDPRRVDLLKRVMALASLRYTHRYFECPKCVDDYSFLSEKVSSLFAHFDAPRCRALLKMDTDSIFCANRFVLAREKIASSYVGSVVRLHPIVNRNSRLALAMRLHNATWLPQTRLRFMHGSAYIVGRDVISERRPVAPSGLEDVDVARSLPNTTRWVRVPTRSFDCRDNGKAIVLHKCQWNETTVCGLVPNPEVDARAGGGGSPSSSRQSGDKPSHDTPA